MKLKSRYFDKPQINTFDWKLFLPVLGLLILGLVSILSTTTDTNAQSFFYRQLTAIGLGLAGMLIIFFLPKNFINTISPFVYVASIVMLVIVYIFGTEIYGTRGWLRLGGLSFQPAEFAKLGLLLALAKFVSSKGVDVANIRGSGISLLLTIVPAVLIYIQPDHGTATVFAAILVGVLYWSGFNLFVLFLVAALPVLVLLALKGFVFYIIGALLASIIAILLNRRIMTLITTFVIFVSIGFLAPIIYNNLHDHQKARIETFLNPGQDPRGTGYNVIQSKMAVGSGGITGKGYKQGTQTQLRYIPMQRTDFIFSVPTEEFGFIGGSIVLVLFVWMLLRLISLASMLDKFSGIVAAGAAVMILYHCTINIGMVIGIIPVMGIPLPFMSYAGSSMIVNLALIGILLNAYRNNKLKRAVQ